MNEINNNGTLRVLISKIEVQDYRVKDIITDALIEKGYDVDISPINNNFNGPCNCEISVFEKRIRN
ncbi:hypothetical protein HYH43_07160 [Clostridium botulinum]|uniref:hypothetical protein n=1 Tax=Clostridium botulinum TaxID=1491 RepID=UPI0013FBF323|nr:hypothetical protein [Clostridium botulinum]MBY6789216.1 hypothetical protein [Clostridium botulinum]MBY6949853.1 hypothetical protein [Clostridium botulinum]MBY7022930.1 hypothetical protein [Clostridium botulinum]NFI33825.1 hypothetical protein [Clostridium botulinum]